MAEEGVGSQRSWTALLVHVCVCVHVRNRLHMYERDGVSMRTDAPVVEDPNNQAGENTAEEPPVEPECAPAENPSKKRAHEPVEADGEGESKRPKGRGKKRTATEEPAGSTATNPKAKAKATPKAKGQAKAKAKPAPAEANDAPTEAADAPTEAADARTEATAAGSKHRFEKADFGDIRIPLFKEYYVTGRHVVAHVHVHDYSGAMSCCVA